MLRTNLIASYRSRYFLRDGCHRAAGLIRAGIFTVPAIVVTATNFEYVASHPALLSYETAFSDKPPLLTDFWNEDVSYHVSQPAVRKVVRARAGEFVVQG